MKKFYAIKSKRIGYMRYINIRMFSCGIRLVKKLFSNVYEMPRTQKQCLWGFQISCRHSKNLSI